MARITYETHFKSHRPDGRHVASYAAYRERMLAEKPKLSFPHNVTPEIYRTWRERVIAKYREILRVPAFTEQPAPVKLSEVQREGYRVEKWEYYPDDFAAVPILILIPDGVSKDHPAPGVICVPGADHSKELLAGEPFLDPPNCRRKSNYPEKNAMAKILAQNGMVAIATDNVGCAEIGFATTDPETDGGNFHSRDCMIYGYLFCGTSYQGMQTFHIMNLVKNLPYFDGIDLERIAVSAHSLGTIPALSAGLFCDEIKGVVFNDFVCSMRDRYICTTENEEGRMTQVGADHLHNVPGQMEYFDIPELLAALAPKYLALNEGGADVYIDIVRKGYEMAGAPDHMQFTHYPRFQNPEDRRFHGEIPTHGLTAMEFTIDWCYCDVPEHAFKAEPSLKLLKKCFGL